MNFAKSLFLILVLIMLATECVHANTITCNFDFGLKSITVNNVFNKKTLEKETYNNGIKIKYHIENTKNFDEINDYITMENSKGHKITYALSCF